nr:hypothetical protein [Streptomyces polyasparticus]
MRATAAAVTGALALSAFLVPAAAQAEDSRQSLADAARSAQPAPTTRAAVAAQLPITFSGVKVNGGKPIVVGTTNIVTVPVTYTLTHDGSVDIYASDFVTDVELFRGDLATADKFLYGDVMASCTAQSATVASCKGQLDVYPQLELDNVDAGSWKAVATALDYNGQDPSDPDNVDWSQVDYAQKDLGTAAKLQRNSRLTVNAGPEPVTKGKKITVTGDLTRANWDTNTYTGYTSQPVKVQFRKKGTSTYTTVKTAYSSSTSRKISTTVTASVDGYWRLSFAGTSTTDPFTTAGDYVDVR